MAEEDEADCEDLVPRPFVLEVALEVVAVEVEVDEGFLNFGGMVARFYLGPVVSFPVDRQTGFKDNLDEVEIEVVVVVVEIGLLVSAFDVDEATRLNRISHLQTTPSLE